MEITGAHVLGEVMHVARHSRELMLIGKKKGEVQKEDIYEMG